MRDLFELAGRTIDGPIEIERVVGEGGFGVVCRGLHKGFGLLVVVVIARSKSQIARKTWEEP